ncbi:Cucumber peeling cupredoxin [Quillaja saponaria]|uniref:Cucumber peeling cupredoxin n=1 Tax=Quillaja saponaria TaxID=32244 RepID=A0AAD7QCE8_QUISA|nr:Cucumber peeling cupredoxin [Quillaja saponaria]
MARDIDLVMWSLIVVLILLNSATTEAATTTEVGGTLGWTVPPNQTYYNEWATAGTFNVGDTLKFKWTGEHNVAHVSKDNYENCTTDRAKISGQVLQGDGEIDFKLEESGTHYFICTVNNHCARGQKFSINIGGSPSAEAPNSSAPPGLLYFVALPAILSNTVLYFLSQI